MPDQVVLLDIGVGSSEEHDRAANRWSASQSFLAARSSALGLPSAFETCSQEQLELAAEAYSADPAWAKQVAHQPQALRHSCMCTRHLTSAAVQGPFCGQAPPSLLAGRLVISLHSPVR